MEKLVGSRSKASLVFVTPSCLHTALTLTVSLRFFRYFELHCLSQARARVGALTSITNKLFLSLFSAKRYSSLLSYSRVSIEKRHQSAAPVSATTPDKLVEAGSQRDECGKEATCRDSIDFSADTLS